jgi:hypothetical protein
VNRLRLLKRADDLEKVPQGLRSGPLRLPFRVDLRDFAAWLHGANPFGEETAPRAGLSRRSLESFLAAQVESFSGGAQFGVSDLHAVARVSSLLIALDGLDEVAVIEERERVVEEATAGLKRLADVAPAIDAVVTTRPAAFENSPGFDRRLFRYFELASLGSEASLLYAEKWIKVRQLEPKAAGAVRRVVREKLDEPHLRELARNPMQLAILLSLIHQRGVSLPDKRTALYDNYVDLFFAREAEKTPNVAEHRDLLLEIHQFLAWRLQTEVENGNSQGSISTDRLKLLLRDYLLREEKDVSLVDVLFSSLVERVVAIVSRVEGTYEFEVQPLREYFAARFLYDTAHHSSPGNERPGDKTDRFDALARNFYWLNATRFFAGCFSKGELLSLVERLEVLAEEDGFRHTDHPRVLASMLLTDWVFAQSPKAMKAVVRIVLRDVAMRGQPSRSDDVFALPLGSGQKEVAERCWELWRQDLPRDRSTAVAETLRRNSVPAEIDAEWLSAMSKASSEERTRWLERGLWTGSLSRAETSSLPKLLADEVGLFDRRRLQALLDAGQAGIYLDDQETRQFAIDAMLDGAVSSATHDAPRSLLGALSQIGTLLNSELVQRADSGWWGRSAPDNWRGQSSRLPRVSYLIRSVRKHVHAGTPWHVSLTPWNEVVEAMRRADGDRWLALELAVAGAGVRDPGDKGSVGHGIFDSEHPLCERARYMRMRYGNAGWWTRHLSEAQTSFDQVFLTAMFVAWASPKTLRAAIEPFDSWFRQAPEEERQAVYRAVKRARLLRNLASANAERADIRELPPVAPETAVAVMERNTIIDADIAIYSAHFKGRHSDCGIVAADLARVANAYARREPGHWPVALEAVAKAYAFGFSSGNAWDEREVRFEVPFARAIVDSAERYPLWVIAAAERVCRGQMGHETIALAAVAAKQDWEWV